MVCRPSYVIEIYLEIYLRNCGVKNLGLDLLKGKADTTSNARKQMVEHHPHHSEQFPLAMPR